MAEPAELTVCVRALPVVPAPLRSISVPLEFRALTVIVLFRHFPAVVFRSPRVSVDAVKKELA